MEHLKNDNLSLLEAVVQNTEMGKNTLEQIVPMTDDVQFKAELLRERNIYRELTRRPTPPSRPAAEPPRARAPWQSSTPEWASE